MSSPQSHRWCLHVRAAVTMDSFPPRVDGERWIVVEEDLIAEVRETAPEGVPVVEAMGAAAIPGLINAHTHLAMSLYRGLADDETLSDWLFKNLFPMEEKWTSAEMVTAGVELAALECLRSGTTVVGDMYYFPQQTLEALDRMGLGGVAYAAYDDRPTPDDPHKKKLWKDVIPQLADQWKSHPRLEVGLGPHSGYTVGDETLKETIDLAFKIEGRVSIHAAESETETNQSLKQYGKRPIERMLDLGLSGEGTIYAHGVQVSSDEVRRMTEAGSSVIYNPESNMKLGSGAAPLPLFLENGMNFGLGTDGSASNNNLDLLQEMDSGAKLQKFTARDPSEVKAAHLLWASTRGGAKALGLESRFGSIEKGKQADLVLLDLEQPEMWPTHDLISQIVYSASSASVRQTYTAGRLRYDQGQFPGLDSSKILANASTWVKRMKT